MEAGTEEHATLRMTVKRIASLLPSTTEIACALGFEDRLVGRSHECDHPASVVSLPALTAPKLDSDTSSRTIDDRVKQLVREGLSVYRVDAERLRALAPDVILTQDQCEVCAASLGDVEEALSAWTGGAPRLVSLSPATLGDVWVSFSRVADALGAPERGLSLATELANRITEVAERTQRMRSRPRIACIEWLDPLMVAGNWVPELVTLAGGENLLGKAGSPSRWLAANELAAADPDVIVVLPCGFDLPRTRAELADIVRAPDWQRLRAVREGRIAIVDGNQYFSRPGPRLVESLQILAEILHSKEFDPEHRGTGWAPF